jgi:DNA polymerase delta subunit 1
MPEAVPPHKRALTDTTTNPRGNAVSPAALKKRKLDIQSSSQFKAPAQNTQRKGFGSSQPQKSQFEEEVLEKLTQDIGGLKGNNAEKDQQWERPPLGDFDPTKEAICFQQIDAEEGRFGADKMAVRLFGVTEVNILVL